MPDETLVCVFVCTADDCRAIENSGMVSIQEMSGKTLRIIKRERMMSASKPWELQINESI